MRLNRGRLQILRFTSRALSQIWSDTYLDCWRRWCRSLSALLIERQALEISPACYCCCRCCLSYRHCLDPLFPSQGHSAVEAAGTSVTCAKRHERGVKWGFIREQLCLLVYLHTLGMLSNCAKKGCRSALRAFQSAPLRPLNNSHSPNDKAILHRLGNE